MIFDQDHVKIHGCVIIRNAITVPDKDNTGLKDRYSLKVVIPPNSPDLPDAENLANSCLQHSEFRGVLPAGGYMPIGDVQPGEFNNMFPGWKIVKFKTTFLPDVYDENGQKLDPMQYSPMLFGNQKVDILCHSYSYNTVSKGIALGLDAFSIIASAGAQPVVFATGGMDTSGAFSPGGVQAPPPANTTVVAPPPTAADPVLMSPGLNYAEHITAGWTNESLIANGKATAHAVGGPTQATNFLPGG